MDSDSEELHAFEVLTKVIRAYESGSFRELDKAIQEAQQLERDIVRYRGWKKARPIVSQGNKCA